VRQERYTLPITRALSHLTPYIRKPDIDCIPDRPCVGKLWSRHRLDRQCECFIHGWPGIEVKLRWNWGTEVGSSSGRGKVGRADRLHSLAPGGNQRNVATSKVW